MKVNSINHYVAEVTDYDYKDSAIVDVFKTHRVLCIRNENPVAPAQLIRLGEMFGEVYSHKLPLPFQSDAKLWVDGERKVFRVSNAVDKDNVPLGGLGNIWFHWHCDASHEEGEFHGTILYNHYNGHLANTTFSDQAAAYHSLDDQQKAEFKNVTGHHMINHGPTRPQVFGSFEGSGDERRAVPVKRPMVMKHPFTKEPCLYISPVTWAGCEPDNPSLTKEYIQTLAEKTNRNIYTHEWHQYDVGVFDSIGTMHERKSWNHGIRVMHRLHFNYDNCLEEKLNARSLLA